MPLQDLRSMRFTEQILCHDLLVGRTKNAKDGSLQRVDDIDCLALGQHGRPELKTGQDAGVSVGDVQRNRILQD
jgi:hypothetical protein